MTTPQVKIVNAETGEETVRDMNAEELTQLAKEVIERESIEAAETKAATDKAAATAKLAALGLTTDDLKALGLGTN